MNSNGFDGLAARFGIHLFQDAMDVISHRKLRKIQVRSDFFICETFGDECDQLLLPHSKIRP